MENGKEFDLPSGAKLYVSVSAYEQVMALHDALASELRGKGVGALDIVEIQKARRGESEDGLNVLVDKGLALAASREVKDAVFACAAQAVYRPDGTEATSVTVSKALFDHPQYRFQAREDFYAILTSVAEVNLGPFVKALFSMFAAHVGKRADTQKSSTGPEPARP